MEALTLRNAAEGNYCKIKSVELGKLEKERLSDLGLVPGTVVKVLQKSPLGDPTCYFIRGSVIALRQEYTEKIKAEKTKT